MDSIDNILKRLKEFFKVEKNIELAKALNISYNTLNTWLKRKRIPQDFLVNLAIKYNLSLDWLLLGKESQNTSAKTIEQEVKQKEFIEAKLYKKTIFMLDKEFFNFYFLLDSNLSSSLFIIKNFSHFAPFPKDSLLLILKKDDITTLREGYFLLIEEDIQKIEYISDFSTKKSSIIGQIIGYMGIV